MINFKTSGLVLNFTSGLSYSEKSRSKYLGGSERIELVSDDHEIGQRIEPHRAVVVPVGRDDVQRQRGQVALRQEGSAEVGRNVAAFREVDAVPAHLGHDVLPEDDDFLLKKTH